MIVAKPWGPQDGEQHETRPLSGQVSTHFAAASSLSAPTSLFAAFVERSLRCWRLLNVAALNGSSKAMTSPRAEQQAASSCCWQTEIATRSPTFSRAQATPWSTALSNSVCHGLQLGTLSTVGLAVMLWCFKN